MLVVSKDGESLRIYGVEEGCGYVFRSFCESVNRRGRDEVIKERG